MATVSRASLPVEKSNYRHLVMDIAWFGLALAATTRFLQFYALEMGATAIDLGWLTALPALVIIFTTMLSPWWRSRYHDSVSAVILPGLGHRLLFLLPAFAPFFPEHLRVPYIIFASTLPTIAQGTVASIFVVMMRETIRDKDLQPLLTQRHMAMNITITIGAIVFGIMLEKVAFPLNYQIMFLVAFIFSMFSEWHLTRLHVLNPEQSRKEAAPRRTYRELFADSRFQSVALVVLVSFLVFHVIIAVIPLQLKDHFNATEAYLGVYGALEVASAFGITLVLNRLIARFGNRGVIALGLFVNGIAALVVALAPDATFALLSAVLTGASWSAIGVCAFGFFAERTAKDDMQAAMVYNQLAYVAIFVGPLIGSFLVNAGVSVIAVLLAGAALRFAGAAICHFGLRVFGRKRVEPVYDNPLLER